MKTRREFLHSIGFTLAAGSVATNAVRAKGIVSGAVGDGFDPSALAITLTFPDGLSKRFEAKGGIDLGDFVVPFAGIVQRNIVVKDPDSIFSVYFRPDRNSDRIEVVVLYGNLLIGSPATIGAYACEIFRGGLSIGKVDVPYHFWLARWRWATAARPRVRTPADLVAAKLIVPYAKTSLAVQLPGAAPAYTIMGHSSVTPYMDQTGERGDIGINPEVTSAYLATGSETCYRSMMEWAEASSTGPWHLNDPKTGGIINWDNWPTANIYDVNRSTPKIYVSKKDTEHKDFIHPGDAHHPMLSYVPFLSTGDPYHAEELQYTINYYLGGEHNTKGLKTYIFDSLQTRGYAWMLRSAVFAYLACDEIQSPILLPKAFWKKVIDNNAAWITTNFVNGTDSKTKVFSSAISRAQLVFWQEDYLCAVLGVMQRLEKFPEWRPVLDWKIRSNINRLNGSSGWPRTRPTIYYAQWFEQIFTAHPNNKGNGSITQGKYNARINPEGSFGDWSVIFVDDQSFKLKGPSGQDMAGEVGAVDKPFLNGHGVTFVIHSGSLPFQAGDSFALTMQPVTTWTDLARVNGVSDSVDGSLQGANGEYMSHLYAALAAGAPIIPEVRPLLDWLTSKMENAGGRVSWRDSLASA